MIPKVIIVPSVEVKATARFIELTKNLKCILDEVIEAKRRIQENL
jgi:hypothetical protein